MKLLKIFGFVICEDFIIEMSNGYLKLLHPSFNMEFVYFLLILLLMVGIYNSLVYIIESYWKVRLFIQIFLGITFLSAILSAFISKRTFPYILLSVQIVLMLWYHTLRFLFRQLGYKKVGLLDGVWITTSTVVSFYFMTGFLSLYIRASNSTFIEYFFDLLLIHFSLKVIWKFFNVLFTNGNEIYVLGSGPSADGGHWRVQIENVNCYELFKENARTSGAVGKPLKNKRPLRKIEWYEKFYIPFVQYGVIGRTTTNSSQADIYFVETYNELDDHYNSVYSSCQEFCSLFLEKLRIRFGISDLKETVLLFFLTIIWYKIKYGKIQINI